MSRLGEWWGMMVVMAEAQGVSKGTLIFMLSLVFCAIVGVLVGGFFFLRYVLSGG